MKLPREWASANAEDVCEKVSVGIVIEPSKHYTSDPNGVRAFRSANVRAGKINNSNWVRLSPEGHAANRKSQLRSGDVVIVRTGAPGTACVVTDEFAGSNCIDLIFARPKTDLLNSDYFCVFINSDHGKRQALNMQGGLAQQHLNVGAFQKIKVPVPPLPEQIKIADILTTWDEALTKLDALIDAQERRKKALMQQLLTGRRRLKGFTDRWKPCRFGDFLVESRMPGNDGSNANKLTVRLYGRGVIQKKERLAGSENTRYYQRKMGQFIYSKLDFLNGAFGIIPGSLDGYESTLDVPAFDFRPTVNSKWLLHFVCREEFYSQQLSAAAGGRKARRVNPSDFLAMKLLAPSLDEQRQIAVLLDTADQQLILLRTQRTALDQQKRGLMQRLLTGKLRVSV